MSNKRKARTSAVAAAAAVSAAIEELNAIDDEDDEDIRNVINDDDDDDDDDEPAPEELRDNKINYNNGNQDNDDNDDDDDGGGGGGEIITSNANINPDDALQQDEGDYEEGPELRLQITPEHTSDIFVNQFVDYSVCLVDRDGRLKTGLKPVPLNIFLVVNDTSEQIKKVSNGDKYSLEFDKKQTSTSYEIGSDGVCQIKLSVKELSRNRNNSRFRIEFHAADSAASFLDKATQFPIPVSTNPFYVVNYRLELLNRLPELWFKDQGGKDKSIDVSVKIVGPDGVQPKDLSVPLKLTLMYPGDIIVPNQSILRLNPESKTMLDPKNGTIQLRFRIEDVSKNHQSKPFVLKVEPDTGKNPLLYEVASAYSNPVQVRSKMSNVKKVVSKSAGTVIRAQKQTSSDSSFNLYPVRTSSGKPGRPPILQPRARPSGGIPLEPVPTTSMQLGAGPRGTPLQSVLKKPRLENGIPLQTQASAQNLQLMYRDSNSWYEAVVSVVRQINENSQRGIALQNKLAMLLERTDYLQSNLLAIGSSTRNFNNSSSSANLGNRHGTSHHQQSNSNPLDLFGETMNYATSGNNNTLGALVGAAGGASNNLLLPSMSQQLIHPLHGTVSSALSTTSDLHKLAAVAGAGVGSVPVPGPVTRQHSLFMEHTEKIGGGGGGHVPTTLNREVTNYTEVFKETDAEDSDVTSVMARDIDLDFEYSSNGKYVPADNATYIGLPAFDEQDNLVGFYYKSGASIMFRTCEDVASDQKLKDFDLESTEKEIKAQFAADKAKGGGVLIVSTKSVVPASGYYAAEKAFKMIINNKNKI